MDFELTQEQQMLVKMAKDMSEKHFRAKAFTWEKNQQYPWENAKILAKNGMLGFRVPEEDGGGGASLMDACLVMEQITMVCPNTADVFQAGNFGAIQQIAFLGSKELKAEVFPRLFGGETIITAGMSEPNAGSAVTDLRTKAHFEGDEVVINGSKIFNSNGDSAGYFCVWARFGEGVKSSGAVIVPDTAPGFSRGKIEHHMSGEPHCALYFDNCRLPKRYVLISENGFRKLFPVFNVERMGNSTRSLACAQLAFDLAVQYAKDREQFNRPLCEFQGLQWKFADMKTRLDAARLLLYRAVVHADKGTPSEMESSIAKLACNETAEYVTREAMQIHGGYGFSTEFPLAYLYTRARGWLFGGGTPEMMRNRIAERIFDRHFDQRPPRPPKA
jgi:alkylation response protein AidB-like acyl-CoA dehydrogenase